MSLNGEDYQSFFSPLVGNTTTFLLEGRRTNLAFATMVTGFLARAHNPCAILDLDAFYSSNSDYLFSSLDAATAKSTSILVPEPGSDVGLELPKLFEASQKVVIIDSLNTLYHLIFIGDGGSRSRTLAFVLAGLSYFARTNEKVVILSMYRRERFYRARTDRSISALSDATASVAMTEGELKIRSERGPHWPGRTFVTRTPSV